MGRGALSIQKNEKITRTVPILKLNFQYFLFIYFLIFVLERFLELGVRLQYELELLYELPKNI